MEYYNRYKSFIADGQCCVVPRLNIDVADTDLTVVFDKSRMRMDTLSYKYFNDPNFGWLILLANPHLGSMEFLIPDKAKIRIPYPLGSALKRYESEVKKYIESHR